MKFSILALIALAMISLVSCEKFDNPVGGGNDGGNGGFDTLRFTVTDYDINTLDLTDGNLERDLSLMPILPDFPIENNKINNGKDRTKLLDDSRKKHTPFNPILNRLELDSNQKVAILNHFIAYRDCSAKLIQDLYNSQMEILKAANEELKSIREAYKAGELTKREALNAITKLSYRTRKALLENPMNKIVKDGLKDCYETLITNIKSELNESQLAIFEQWLKRYMRIG